MDKIQDCKNGGFIFKIIVKTVELVKMMNVDNIIIKNKMIQIL